MSDPSLRSWVPVPPQSHFPIQNLPYGVIRRRDQPQPRLATAIGDFVLDLAVLEARGLLALPGFPHRRVFSQPVLNDFLALGRQAWQAARSCLVRLLQADQPILRDDPALQEHVLLPRTEVELLLPVRIGDYTDFYSSREHASNVGTMLRGPENALMPNWLHLPVAYHGRASSVVVSGTDLHRPWGQLGLSAATAGNEASSQVEFGPSRALDFELEMGFFIGPGNELGRPIPVEEAAEHIFGLVLVNDWSARDIQKWEYQPLGPFLAKNFGTSISPWVVPLEALEPFRCPGPVQDPVPLPYLRTNGDQALDIHLEVYLQTQQQREPARISASNFKFLYWNMAQQLAHHTVNGCNLQPGDLLASGTISGPSPDSCGSLLELAWKGSRPIRLPSGESRAFLHDGDRVTLTGWCEGPGYRVGFGECTGQVLPARD
jgi:fumarylacetoacetase